MNRLCIRRARLALHSSIVTTALLLASSAAAQTEQSLVGCYDIRLEPWAPQSPGGDSTYYAPPPRVQLSVGGGRGLGGQVRDNAVEPAPGAMPSVHGMRTWSLIGSDSIRVVLSTGFSGLSLRLAIADTLHGYAETFTDVVPGPKFTARARAIPVSCEAPLLEENRIGFRFSPAVRFADSDSLVIDSPLSPRLDSARAGPHIVGRPLEPYSGAERTEVALRPDGTLRSIRIYYPAAMSFDVLVQQLIAAHGVPTSSYDDRTRMRLWSSRLLTISARATEAGPLVMIYSQQR